MRFCLPLVILSSFVFFIFYYRFFRTQQRQFGCLKALGFQDKFLQSYFVIFTALFSLIGSLIGLAIAYPLSNVLIQANVDAYKVSGLVKSVNMSTVLMYCVITTTFFSLTAFFSYFFIKGKEAGTLLSGNTQQTGNNASLRIADKISNLIPVKNKFPIRLALRKPITVLLIFVAVMSFVTCMILAYSLNGSSEKVFNSQTDGHNYNYLTTYDQYISANKHDDPSLEILTTPAMLFTQKKEIAYTVNGLYNLNSLYELKDDKHNALLTPTKGNAIIGEELQTVYGVEIGEFIGLKINNQLIDFKVTAIAENAQLGTVYVNGDELATLLGLPQGSYNLLLTNKLPLSGEITSHAERIDALERDAVSNHMSGVINQIIGIVIGSILLFLALYMTFQNNTRDMLIMHMIGYQSKNIRKMFIDIYKPLVLIFFAFSLFPSILIVKNIQKNLSIATGDYMPFGTNVGIILLILFILMVIYQLVQCLCGTMLKRIIQNAEIDKYLSDE